MLVLHRSSLPIWCLRLTSVSLRFSTGDRSGMDTPWRAGSLPGTGALHEQRHRCKNTKKTTLAKRSFCQEITVPIARSIQFKLHCTKWRRNGRRNRTLVEMARTVTPRSPWGGQHVTTRLYHYDPPWGTVEIPTLALDTGSARTNCAIPTWADKTKTYLQHTHCRKNTRIELL